MWARGVCGRSAGCVLCALWAVSAAVCVGGVPCEGKHIIIGTPLLPGNKYRVVRRSKRS